MATTTQKMEAIGVTLTGGAVGAMVGGPVGFGVGLAVGAVIDFFILKTNASAPSLPPGVLSPVVAMAMTPGAPGLPPAADTAAASNAVHLMLLGKPAEVTPARGWLTQFQTSVGLPATGKLDPQTRSLLILATVGGAFDASRLPAVTILG